MLKKTNRALLMPAAEKGSSTALRRNRTSNTAHYKDRTQKKNMVSYPSLYKKVHKQPFRHIGNALINGGE